MTTPWEPILFPWAHSQFSVQFLEPANVLFGGSWFSIVSGANIEP